MHSKPLELGARLRRAIALATRSGNRAAPPRHHPRRIGLLCLIDLVQDAELILPVAHAARAHGGFEVGLVLTDWLDRVAPAIGARVSEEGFAPTRCSRHALANLQFNNWDALLTASESTSPSHRFARALTTRAHASGLATFTMQHGLENIGLTYRGDGEHDFASQWIFTWGDPSGLPNWVSETVRSRCIGVGRPEPSSAPHRPLPLSANARPLVGIFENLHWERYDEDYRRQFIADLKTTAIARPDVLFLVRPHPAGRFLANKASANLPENFVIADPTRTEWAPITAGDVLSRARAAITTPSTIALDAAKRSLPVAVAAYGLDLEAYAPLPLLAGPSDWSAFLERALSHGADQDVKGFYSSHCLVGDASAAMLDAIATRANPRGATIAPTLGERAVAKLIRTVRALPSPLSHLAPSASQYGYAPSRNLYRRWIKAYDTLDEADHDAIREACAAWGDTTIVSVIIDAREASHAAIAQTQRAIHAQYLTQHEVILCDSADSFTSALARADAPLATVITAGDLIPPHALYVLAALHRETPDALLAYSDEDVLDEQGRRTPHFKPDWSPELLLAQDYACRLVMFDVAAARATGARDARNMRTDLHDLLVRMHTAAPKRPILHAPYVLYHARPRAPAAAKQAPQRSSAASQPVVTLIVPTRDQVSLLRRCIEGLRTGTSYPAIEIIIVDNCSMEPETLAYLEDVKRDPRVRVLRDDGAFNFSRLNNQAVREARGTLIGLLNNDTAVLTPDWLDEMAALAQKDGVGAVGAMLLYPNGNIQHAGCVLGIGGVAGHIYRDLPAETSGHGGRLFARHELSAVTAACLISPRAAWDAVNGLDEQLPTAYNDIDYCLRLRQAGYRVLWTPFARLEHHESASRGRDERGARRARLEREKIFMRTRWGDRLYNDPYYTPNLTLTGLDAGLAFPPRTDPPWGRL
jgi:GT2 family glycosyltransferase